MKPTTVAFLASGMFWAPAGFVLCAALVSGSRGADPADAFKAGYAHGLRVGHREAVSEVIANDTATAFGDERLADWGIGSDVRREGPAC